MQWSYSNAADLRRFVLSNYNRCASIFPVNFRKHTRTENDMSETPIPANDNEPLDLLWGCEAIARAIGRTKRQTFHMLETGQLPAHKIGERWVVSRAALREHFAPKREAA